MQSDIAEYTHEQNMCVRIECGISWSYLYMTLTTAHRIKNVLRVGNELRMTTRPNETKHSVNEFYCALR